MPLDSLIYFTTDLPVSIKYNTWTEWKQTWVLIPRRTTGGKLTAGRCYTRLRVILDSQTGKEIIEEQYAANEFDMLRADKHEAPL